MGSHADRGLYYSPTKTFEMFFACRRTHSFAAGSFFVLIVVDVEKLSYISESGYGKAGPEADFGTDCGSILLFPNYAVFNRERWVRSPPFSRFIQYFFRLNANPRKNSSTRTFAFPRVKNLRKPKSVFKSPNAPSTWIERHKRR